MRRWGGACGALCLAAVVTSPGPAAAQLRRDAPVEQAAAVREGDVLIGVGVAAGRDASFPLSGLRGDLFGLGETTLAWGLADQALLRARWTAFHLLDIDEFGDSSIPLEPAVADGKTYDVGDVRLGASFLPLGRREGWSAGGRIEVELPNSHERRGIGTNTSDVLVAAVGAYGSDEWQATASLGVRILEVPLESFSQNDVLDYAFEATWRVDRRWELAAALEGHAHTAEGEPPPGTEPRGTARLALRHRFGSWLLDAGGTFGLAQASPDWGLTAGVSWLRTRED